MAGRKAKPPKEVPEFRIAMYALQQYKGWTDADLAEWLGCSAATVARMRNDPFSAGGDKILRILSMARKAEADY